MATQVGVGYSEDIESTEAGLHAASLARERSGAARCDLAIVTCTPTHDPGLLHKAVRSVVGPQARVIGGCSAGVITSDAIGFDGSRAAVAVLASDSLAVNTFIETGLVDNERAVGEALGAQMRQAHLGEDANVLLFLQAVARPLSQGLLTNRPRPFLEGLGAGLESWPATAGLGMMGGVQWTPAFQWFDDRAEEQAAMALVLSGDVAMDTTVMHALRPRSSYHTITRVEGRSVLEIDGVPALEFVQDLLGPDAGTAWEEFPLLVTLGANEGDRFGSFRPEDYVNQICIAVDPDRSALIMNEPYFRPGTSVQLMRRVVDFEEIQASVDELFDRAGKRTPVLAFYIDCSGRAGFLTGTEGEDAEEVRRAIGGRVPLVGMYSGFELARVGAGVRPLIFAGVLCLLTE